MIKISNYKQGSSRTSRRMAALLVVFLLAGFGMVPEASADCRLTVPTSDLISIEGCAETSVGGNVSSVTVAVPSVVPVASDDLLVAVVNTDGAATFAVPAGWNLLLSGDSGANSLAVYTRISDGSEPANYTFSWGSNERVYAYMLHMKGANGTFYTNTASGAGDPFTAPAVTTTVDDSLILRVISYDDDDYTPDAANQMNLHTTITHDESDANRRSASGTAVFANLALFGGSGTGTFNQTGGEQWFAATIGIEPGTPPPPPPPPFLCPGDDGEITGSQLVVMQQCTETKVGSNVADIVLDTPSAAADGDFMLAFISSDGNETITEPAGWSPITEATNSGMTFAVYQKFVDVGEPPTHTFSTGTNEEKYGYILLLTDASGYVLAQTGASGTDNNTPVTPALETFVDDTLIVRASGHDDDDLLKDPAGDIVSGFSNITADSSSGGNGTTSGQAVYVNQESPAVTPAVNFSLTANEEWRTVALGIEPIEFHFTMPDSTASVCGIQQVTLSVRDSQGGLVSDFVGTVTLRVDSGTATGAEWLDLDGSLANVIPPSVNGLTTYTFGPLDGGQAIFDFHNPNATIVNFGMEYDENGPVFNEHSSADPSLTIDANCEFRIEHDGAAGTCGMELVTFTLVDSEGVQATHYTGTVDITAVGGISGATGFFSVNTGVNPTIPVSDDDNGAVSYLFDAADNAQVILAYSNFVAETVNFDAQDTVNSYITDTDDVANYDPPLVISACEIRITIADVSNESDVCSVAEITLEITNSVGATIADFNSTVSLSTDTFTGDWLDWPAGATNSVNNGAAGDGAATILFDSNDLGTVTLGFSNSFETPALNPLGFLASATASDGSPLSQSATVNDELTVLPCTVDIQVTDGAADVCTLGEVVTYTIRDRNGVTAQDYEGTLVLTNDKTNGDYVASGEFGTFDNATADDGIATYAFHTDDDGVLTVTFSNNVAETVNLTASAPSIALDGGSNAAVIFSACEFQISYIDGDAGIMDVCTPEIVQIEIVGSGGVVTGYTGTINLSTTTGNGTWAISDADGPLTDPVAEDGSASYTFQGTDAGHIELLFSDLTNETVNINVSDGINSDPNDNMDPFDPDLTVELCTFQISFFGGGALDPHNNASSDACSIQQVTIEVYNRLGALDTDYAGVVNLSTDFNHGNWAVGDGAGTLTDTPGDDNGLATYEFVAGDGGDVVLDFTNLNTETLNIDLEAGVIVEEGSADPNLEIQSCFPIVAAQSCVAGSSTSITIGAQNADVNLQGRMVVMAISFEGNGDVSAATFDTGGTPTAMTKIFEERIEAGAEDNSTELWGILDTDLPAGAGTYSADFTHTDDAPAMCLFYLTDVQQSFPVPDGGTPSNGAVNGTQATATTVASTSITTQENNSLVLSIVGNGSGGDTYDDVSPEPPLSRLFNGPDPGSADFAGSSGVAPTAALVTVDETWGGGIPDRHTHVVASFPPLISGPPIASGYTPVTLFKTYAGSLSYRAIGNTLRTLNNNNNTDACTMGPGPVTATLAMPDEVIPAGLDSTVQAAYLYWFGSGEVDNPPPGADFDNVTFIDPSLTSTNITADELFVVEDVGGASSSYYAAYKDVTPLVTDNGLYQVDDLDIDNGAPWNTVQSCAGGWAMVVVYENQFEQLRVINLFHGFQPFQHSAFTLVPRNFRMAVPDDDYDLPNGQVTHITVEGDDTIFNGDESLQIQDTPGATTYTPLTSYYNPLQAEFNGTVTRPIYTLSGDLDPITPGVQQYYLFDSSLGQGGYEIDYPGVDVGPPAPSAGDEIGSSFGVDVDTHYISGDGNTLDGDDDFLNPFAIAEAEEITTRYSSGQDLVLLIAEVISITNSPIADIEISKSEVGTFKVGGTGTYEFVVQNNGNGADSFGFASGTITVSDTLPAGMTFANIGDVSGDGWTCSVTADPAPASGDFGAFTCEFDIATDWTVLRGANVAGELGETFVGSGIGEQLPTLSATVQIQQADASVFPNLNNDAKNVARVLHSDGTCPVASDGESPDPSTCKSPEFDNVNDLQGGIIDLNDLDDKSTENNNVDSVTTNVRGVETDLAVSKSAVGTFEEGSGFEGAQYQITVSNGGPDSTSANFTITDNDPANITFSSIVADADWNCLTITPTLSCEYVGLPLAPGGSKDLFLNVTVDGTAGQNVTNTVLVTPGPYNFDSNSANDSDTDITAIIAPPVGGQERFLMSVSTALGGNGPTNIDSLNQFEDHDLIIYDPVLDTAVYYYDESTLSHSVVDINATHLLPNGHVIISADATSTIGTTYLGYTPVTFEPGDLVRYDPILDVAELIFDGSAIFTDPGENIDAVYMLDNGNVVISTVDNAGIGGTSWDKSDLVEYDFGGGTASIYLDGSDSDVFGAADATQVDAAYILVDPADATLVLDTFALSTGDVSATIGADVGHTPLAGTSFSRDDVTTLDRAADESENLFLGNVPTGVFLDDDTGTPDPELRLDALHILEDGYLGHFRISQSQAGSTCAAGQITITKHQGLSHDIDTDYYGSIRISTSSASGDWGLFSGSGTLTDAIADDGEAIYTFVPGDNGEVTLSLAIDVVTANVNVDVSNGIVQELGSEDPNFDFNNVITAVGYRDEFTAAALNNNDGTAAWSTNWIEIDDADGANGNNSGAGVAVGNVQIGGGVMSLTSNPATAATGRDPSMMRSADLSAYTKDGGMFLDFDYSYSNLNAADSIIVEVTDDGSNWAQFPAYTGLENSNASFTSESLDLTNAAPAIIDDFTGIISVRFRVVNGYTLASQFNIDNVELRTTTANCGVGQIDHYEIIHDGNGISCLGSTVTIVGHDALHFPAAVGAGEVMNISTNTFKGSWPSVVSGLGTLADLGVQGSAANTDGQATYTWFANEESVQLMFNYTNPTTDPELVNFELSGSYFEDEVTAGHDDNLSIRQAGLLFYNETDQLAGIPTQISGKPSNQYLADQVLTLQAIRTSDEDPTVCEPLFPDTQVVNIEFSAECDDPDNCSVTVPAQSFTVNGNPISLLDQDNLDGAQSYTSVPVTFTNQTSGTGAELALNYSDAGEIELHARYDIPLNNDVDFPITSEDYLTGSDTFVVRPFGFDIDFSLDRAGGGSASLANDANGPAFTKAGQPFSTTVTARRWQAIDDQDFDGAPDAAANLTDNEVTPNFGDEATAAENDITITHALVEPSVAIGTRDGTLGGGTAFNTWVAGTDTNDLTFDEVGIITLSAQLADNNYLNGGEDVQGNVANVGRFYPDNFALSSAAAAAVCSVGNDFTYMGQEFDVSFILEARNASDVTTENYIQGFVKLAGSDFDPDSVFNGVEDNVGQADIDRSARVSSVDGSFSALFDDFGDSSPGFGTISGKLIFSRENDGLGVDGAEDGPFVIRLGTSIEDSDNVAITLSASDIDIDDGVTEPGTPLYRELSSSAVEFRYGRLVLDNSFGPESEPLEIPVRVEYYNGSDFELNEDDSCLVINYVSANSAIDFVPGSYTAPAGTADPLADGDSVIEQGSADFNITLSGGRTADINIEANPNDPDRPFITTAPANGEVGSVLVEIDLTNPGLTDPLDFLTYDWRGGLGEEDIYDEVPEEDNYNDNPRSILEFGSYRAHDRVINWQEIYIGPNL